MGFFKRRKEKTEKPKPVEIKIDYGKIDNFILRRYGLKDIEHKAFFLFLNILFFFSGVISLVVFMYGKINFLNLVGTPVAMLSGWKIYHLSKQHGVKIDKTKDIIKIHKEEEK
ncbi:MAG: hypothetical protein KAW12_21205 [Candidatus Aminicenantes bacterium]|nr:hypothetical protein [Candidatus Aminicenantes bacterium]